MPTDKKSVSLTERRIRDAKPGPKAIIMRDREVSGLGVRVAPGGVKSFVLDYRVNGRRRLATLARCSEISLREVRELAGRELVSIRAGEGDPLERRREGMEAPTVADLVERFLTVEGPARIERGRLTESTLTNYRRQCHAYVLPAIGKRRVADVTRGRRGTPCLAASFRHAQPRAGSRVAPVHARGALGVAGAARQPGTRCRAGPRGAA